MSEDRALSYSSPADVLELMLDGFLTIEEGQAKYRRAGGDSPISRPSSSGTSKGW